MSSLDPQNYPLEELSVTGYEKYLTTFMDYLNKESISEDNYKEVIQIKDIDKAKIYLELCALA